VVPMPPLALTSRPGRQGAPCLRWQGRDEVVRPLLRARLPEGMVTGDGEHVGVVPRLQPVTECAIVPVDRIPTHPDRAHPSSKGACQHLLGQLRLGGEVHRRRHPGFPAPLRVLGPFLRQIQLPIQERPPPAAGVSQEHPDLTILDAPGGPAVLALHADRFAPLLEEAGLVDDQDARRRPQLLGDIRPQSATAAPPAAPPPRGVRPTASRFSARPDPAVPPNTASLARVLRPGGSDAQSGRAAHPTPCANARSLRSSSWSPSATLVNATQSPL
jgi:hypothetical protein